jgi:hypothetical protein
MSKLGLVMVMILMVGRNNAQNYPAPTSEPLTFFVLIQADDGQAFYVRLNNQLYTSSPAGHVILAPLTDSVYTIAIGFPSLPEQRYLLNIHQKDWALRLSRRDNRWDLYDDQGQPVVTVTDPAAIEKPLLAGAKKDDAFSQLMSAIVQDTAVMYNTFAAASPDSVQAPAFAAAAIRITHDTTDPVTINVNPGSPTDTVTSHPAALSSLTTDTATKKPGDTPATTNPSNPVPRTSATVTGTSTAGPLTTGPNATGPPVTAPPVTGPPVTGPPTTGPPLSSAIDPAVPSSPTGVVKLSEHRSSQSLSLVYADHPANKGADTIDVVILIDYPTTAIHHPQLHDTAHSTAAVPHPQLHDTAHSTAAVPHPPSPDTSHSGTPATGKNPKPDTATLASTAFHKSTLPFVNSDCHAFATDYDVDKLRVRILNANSDDDRIQAAYKVFKTKCFTTKQIRALSEVFTTDPAKFKFLATAYPFVSDDLFPELVNLLSDPVYAGRFRTMTDRH